MSERLAIAPPAPEDAAASSNEADVLVGKVVGPDHEGLQNAVDATPGAGYELPVEETSQPEPATSERMYQKAAEDYVPPFARDRNPTDPLQGYEQRVMNDMRREMFGTPEATHNGGENERRVHVAGDLDSVIGRYASLNNERDLGLLHSPEDPFQVLFAGLLEKMHELRGKLQSSNARERAAATNQLTEMTIAMSESVEGRTFSREERLECRAFAPDQARYFLNDIGENLYVSVSFGGEKSEALTSEERDIAQMILEFGHEATLEADKQEILLDGATLFGPAAEKAFVDHITAGYTDESEITRKTDVIHRIYEKLRFRAIRALENQKRNVEYGLAA